MSIGKHDPVRSLPRAIGRVRRLTYCMLPVCLLALLVGAGLDIHEYADGIGTVEPLHKEEIRAKHTGLIDAVLVREGDRVENGHPLFSLDSRRIREAIEGIEDRITVAEAQSKLARKHLDRIRQQALPSDLRYTDSEIRSAQAVLKREKRKLERQQEMFAQGLISRADLDEARSQVELAGAALDRSLKRQGLASSGITDTVVEEARAGYELAQEQLKLLEKERDRLMQRQRALTYRAASSGEIAGILVKIGEQVTPGQLLAVLATSPAQCIRSRVDQTSTHRVTSNQDVLIYSEALPFQEYGVMDGTVLRRSFWPVGDMRGRGADYELIVKIKDEGGDARLPWGSTARIRVRIGETSPLKLLFGR